MGGRSGRRKPDQAAKARQGWGEVRPEWHEVKEPYTVSGASKSQAFDRINRQKTDLNSQLAQGPRTVAIAEARLKAAKDHVQSLRDKLTRAKIDADSKQLQMKGREEKIVDLERKLNAAKENREYQALKDQIAADTQANVVLSDEILEILESIDEFSDAFAAAQQKVQDFAGELQDTTQRIADRKVVLESELARVEAELAEAEKKDSRATSNGSIRAWWSSRVKTRWRNWRANAAADAIKISRPSCSISSSSAIRSSAHPAAA